MKYPTMICQGHMPVLFDGSKDKIVNGDTQRFIQYFLPRNAKVNKASVLAVCRTFHLAFKGMAPDEIYDVLMEQLLKAADKYDPFYSDKVGRVVEILSGKHLPGDFSIDDINQYLDFDGARFVRVLCRHEFLETAPDQGGGRRFRRKDADWPPPAKYLNAGPIGFTYYLQTWFRYYLQQHIERAMSEIEAKEGVYSIDFGRDADDGGMDGDVLEARGALVDRDGQWWENGGSQDKPGIDLSQMNLEWVQHTEDALFADLPRIDRLLLYLVFVREYTWEKLGDALQISPMKARTRCMKIVASLQKAAGMQPSSDDEEQLPDAA